ncbi:MAG: tRNA (adenosine(37)-N6)-threonylcarbamoyltransferase complex transferase subunit TsaD [Bacteroidota bacterium]|nr:tRNA (adenosine(37)-N6)-threonylcarbamoyltransferase complex transferase subunit TsaD [Bacteroidota bacterium]
MITLAIETSCDETSAAILDNDKVLSNVISSQMFHSKHGGVVPEVASREHLKKIIEVTEEALSKANKKLKDVDLISATSEPGLIGAILIGLNFAKSLAMMLDKPFVHVNHIHAHLYSNFLCGQKAEFPFIGLIVSGGHTLLILVEDFFKHHILGRTVDDAAGEAFDKVAKLLGLGYPGGQFIDKLSLKGNKDFHKFPLANIKENEFDFSFSGIKTSVLYFLKKIEFEKSKNEKFINDVAASFQYAVVKSLFNKTLEAAQKYIVKNISVSGGVSANSELREKFYSLKDKDYNVYFPKSEYATDNAAMIGLTGYYKYKLSENKNYFKLDSLKQNAKPKLDYENF